ncbi:MAG: hypothetical protein ACRDL1_08505 [Solirubrobacterales bacterium]
MSATEPATRSVAEVARSHSESIGDHDLEGMVRHWKPGASGSIHGMVDLTVPGAYREWFGALFAASTSRPWTDGPSGPLDQRTGCLRPVAMAIARAIGRLIPATHGARSSAGHE